MNGSPLRALNNLMKSESDSLSSFTVGEVLNGNTDFLISGNKKKRRLLRWIKQDLENRKNTARQKQLKHYDGGLLSLIKDGDYAANYIKDHLWKYGDNEMDFKIVTNEASKIFEVTIKDLKTKKIVFNERRRIGSTPVCDLHVQRRRRGILERYLKIILIDN